MASPCWWCSLSDLLRRRRTAQQPARSDDRPPPIDRRTRRSPRHLVARRGTGRARQQRPAGSRRPRRAVLPGGSCRSPSPELGHEHDPAQPFEGTAGPACGDAIRSSSSARHPTSLDRTRAGFQPVPSRSPPPRRPGPRRRARAGATPLRPARPRSRSALSMSPVRPQAGVVAVGIHDVSVAVAPATRPGTPASRRRNMTSTQSPRPTAADEQGARRAQQDLLPVVAEHAQVVTGHRDASRSRPDAARLGSTGRMRGISVDPDAVEDVDAEVRGPPLVQRRRKGVACRRRQPLAGQRVQQQGRPQHVSRRTSARRRTASR